jgi:hypothetical protein
MINKLLWIVNYKAASMGHPRDNVRETISFNLVQDGMKLDRKGNGDSSAAALVGIFLRRCFFGFVGITSVIVVIVNNKVTVVHLGCLSRLLGLAATLGAGLLVKVKGGKVRGTSRLRSVRGSTRVQRGERANQALRKPTGAHPHLRGGE